MKKQYILQECARRLGDEDPTFIAGPLSSAFSYVLQELAQAECLQMLRRSQTFLLTDHSCTVSGNVMNIATQQLLSLPVGQLPERISDDLLIIGIGGGGRIRRTPDDTFTNAMLSSGVSQTGKPRYWLVYPNMAQIQLFPAPDADTLTRNIQMEWYAPVTLITDTADITEILWADIPTVLAGLYRIGITYRDETLNDMAVAEGRWQQGLFTMRQRITKSMYYGRRQQIVFRDF